MPQSYRFLILPLPLYNQLALWYPLTYFKLINILLGDLKYVGKSNVDRDYLVATIYVCNSGFTYCAHALHTMSNLQWEQ